MTLASKRPSDLPFVSGESPWDLSAVQAHMSKCSRIKISRCLQGVNLINVHQPNNTSFQNSQLPKQIGNSTCLNETGDSNEKY